MIREIESALVAANITLLDIKQCGCLIFKVPKEKYSREQKKDLLDCIRHWSKSNDIKCIILDEDIDVSVVPAEEISRPEIYNIIDTLAAKVVELDAKITALIGDKTLQDA